MEKKFVAKAVAVRLYCDECNEEMELKGTDTKFYELKYLYSCPKCNKIIKDAKKYPYVDFVPTTTPILDKTN